MTISDKNYSPAVIADFSNGKTFGTFKFQYSKYYPVDKTRFIPKEKRLAELMLGSFFCDFLRNNFHRKVSNVRLSEDDSNKKPDVIFEENGKQFGIQITQIEFTLYEERKAISLKVSNALAEEISRLIRVSTPIIVNIFPYVEKGNIPLNEIGRGKTRIFKELSKFIAEKILENKNELVAPGNPVWLAIENNLLSTHFKNIALNPIPKDAFSRFQGKNNVYINYDQDDVAFTDNDILFAVEEIFKKKNGGDSEVLLIWSDRFSLGTKENDIAQHIYKKFLHSSFKEVYFMTFENHISVFTKSLQLWPIKQ